MNEAAYNAIRAVRWSTLKNMRVSPRYYRHRLETPREDTAALRLGRAVHTLVLEPEQFGQYAIWGSTRRGKAWDAFCEEHAGQEILTDAEATTAHSCAHAVLSDPVASRYFGGGARELTLTWRDEETGMPCKARVDYVNGRQIELKTTRHVEPRRFGRQAAELGYQGQLAWYDWGLRENGHVLTADPVVIAVQNEPPYDVACYIADSETMEIGRCLYRRLLTRLAECVEANRWPGVSNERELLLNLPPWADEIESEPDQPLTIGGVPLEL